MTNSAQLSLEQLESVNKIHLGKELSAAQVQELYNIFNQAFSNKLPIEVCLDELLHIDTTSLQTLICAHQKATEENLSFSLTAPKPEITSIFNLLGLEFKLNEMK